MRSFQRATFLLAAATVALSLSGCTGNSPAGSGSASPRPALEAATTSASPSSAPVTSTPAAAAAAGATSQASAPQSSAPPHAGSVTFAFPDGRLSFAHPQGWRVEYEQVAASPAVETATLYDARGNGQVSVYYSQVGDAQAGTAARTILEVEPVPGLLGHFVPSPHASFFVDRGDGAASYRMGLTAGLPVSPDGMVQYGLIRLGDRILTADVLFTGAPFRDDDAAKAWYWGAEGQALKAVLMSFSYR